MNIWKLVVNDKRIDEYAKFSALFYEIKDNFWKNGNKIQIFKRDEITEKFVLWEDIIVDE